jgi:hypothetical protein
MHTTFLMKNFKTYKHRRRWNDNEMNLTAIGHVEKHNFGTGPMADFCEHGNEPLGSISSEVFINHLKDYLLLKSNTNPWI